MYGTVPSSVFVHAGRFAWVWACGFRYVCIPLYNMMEYYVDYLSYFCIMFREKPQGKKKKNDGILLMKASKLKIYLNCNNLNPFLRT